MSRQWIKKIQQLPLPEKIRIMNVCGGHERTISISGIRTALPRNIELIPGPGCPVCICPEEDVYQAIQLALHEKVILVAYGDMLRVPVNVAKNEINTLEKAKAAGAHVIPIASPMEAVSIAENNPLQPVVFFVAGFETTTAPTAAMLAQGVPGNLYLLLSGRLTWPAVAMLLNSEKPGFDAIVAPGHVAAVMGPEEWAFITTQHEMPVAVAGFTPDTLLAAIYSVIRQNIEQQYFLDNCYPDVVHSGGNPYAKQILQQVMTINDANWRGIGVIPQSGFQLKDPFQPYDARLHFPDYTEALRKRAGDMPPGCDCARVVLGKIYPDQCKLYGNGCTPRKPIGPCMVSDEGACRIWWSSPRFTVQT